jgi:hypothetical protein
MQKVTPSRRFLCLVYLSVSLFSSSLKSLTLEDYVKEVLEKNDQIQVLKKEGEAKFSRREAGGLMFSPTLFTTLERRDDERANNAPSFQGSKTLQHIFQLGVGQQFRTGTKLNLTFSQFKTEIKGASPESVSPSLFYDISPQVELSQDLWRNFLGIEHRAGEYLQQGQIDLSLLSNQFQAKQLMIKAESLYWRLFFLEQISFVEEESLQRAYRLRDWNQKRVRQNLGDTSDLLQAETRVQGLELSHQTTLMDLEAVRRSFNELRQEKEDIPVSIGKDVPKLFGSYYIQQIKIPQQMPEREDLQMAKVNAALNQAQSVMGEEKYKPSLQLYGSMSLNGRDNLYSEALGKSFETNHPYSAIGVRLTTPLDIKALDTYRRAHKQEALVAELSYRRKSFEIEKEWLDLIRKFEDQKKRLGLAIQIIGMEKKKLESERSRYNLGRTTTFQVLQFEQDYANAQVLRLRYEQEIIGLYQQIKMFQPMDKMGSEG